MLNKILNGIKFIPKKISEYFKHEGKGSKRKKIWAVFALLIVILLLVVCCSKTGFDIERSPRLNMVQIERLLYTSNVCDEQWKEDVEILIARLTNEAEELERLGHNNFRMLQLEVARRFQELIDYLRENETQYPPEILVENIRFVYEGYRTYFFDNISGGR